jgi:hypothetical protein
MLKNTATTPPATATLSRNERLRAEAREIREMYRAGRAAWEAARAAESAEETAARLAVEEEKVRAARARATAPDEGHGPRIAGRWDR